MNIDNLSDKNKSRLQSDINKVYNDKPISEKRLEIIISAFAEDGVEVTEEDNQQHKEHIIEGLARDQGCLNTVNQKTIREESRQDAWEEKNG